MKKNIRSILSVVFLVLVFSIYGAGCENYNKRFFVSDVIDGDTIELSNRDKVRYIGIDTPEVRERDGDNWIYNPMPYAEEAKTFNEKLVLGKEVRMEFDAQKKDKYNRLLAYVYVGNTMVNLEILRHGYAMMYTYPPNVKYADEFLKAQNEARKGNKGLWKDIEENIIPTREAKKYTGLIRRVETYIVDTYISENVLILNCRDDFKIVIFVNNLRYFPKMASRSPDTYFKHKSIRVYGLIKDYKGNSEIIINHPSQLEILQ